jgi:hypothetical protein
MTLLILRSLLDNFSIEYFLLFHGLLLLERERSEELNLLFVGRLPLIVHLEGTLKVLFNFYIESLRLNVDEGWIVDTWDCLGRYQVM